MSEKRLYSYDKCNNKVLCNLNDVCNFNVTNVFQLLNQLAKENEQLRKELIQEMKLHQETEEELQEYKSFMGLG